MKHIVLIGGGTGNFTLLRGLREYDVDLTSIVTVFDSGGSSGILRDEFGILPPGDVRKSLVALAGEEEHILRELFNFRFEGNGSLKGHSFGNLFLLALTKITGSEAEAIKQAAKILKVKGKVLPVSLNHADVCAELDNGTVIVGETAIDLRGKGSSIARLFLSSKSYLCEETRHAIENADLIVIGPGDLYSSIIPNLLVSGMSEALRASKAHKAYVCNLMTKPGESEGYTASRFASEIVRYANTTLNSIVCNTKIPAPEALELYAKKGQELVIPDPTTINWAERVIQEDVIGEPDLVRHDPHKIARILMKLV